MSRIRKEWTQEEDDILRKFYPEFGCKYCCEKLNRPDGSIRRRVMRLGLKFYKTPFKYTLEEFAPVINASRSYSDVARRMGLPTGHGNRKTVIKYIVKYSLDISHFDAGYESDRKLKKVKRNLNDILVENSNYSNTQSLKKQLFRFGLKTKICEECGQDEIWRGKQISLHLDHINGNNNDNRLENLRILCPNCHAATDTYCNKNGHSYAKLIPKKEKITTNECPGCGNDKYIKANLCSACDSVRQRKVERPSYSILLEETEKYGYKATGRKYGVSDSTIKKWMKSYAKNADGRE